jgi:hypothetical protein
MKLSKLLKNKDKIKKTDISVNILHRISLIKLVTVFYNDTFIIRVLYNIIFIYVLTRFNISKFTKTIILGIYVLLMILNVVSIYYKLQPDENNGENTNKNIKSREYLVNVLNVLLYAIVIYMLHINHRKLIVPLVLLLINKAVEYFLFTPLNI